MAEVDTQMLSSQHADIRREQADQTGTIRREAAEHRATMTQENMKGFDRVNADVLRGTGETIKEGLKESFNIRGDVKDTRYDLASRVESAKDDVTNQGTAYFIANMAATNEAARDLASLKVLTDANGSRISAELALGIEKAAAATALESQKVASAVALGQNVLGAAIALGQANLSKEIFFDGQKTRDLMNDLKYHDLNRHLVERNTELVDERHGRRHYSRVADQAQFQGQWASLQSQIQAFQSQLQTATQGTVNFGTMSGNAGRNSSTNNVA